MTFLTRSSSRQKCLNSRLTMTAVQKVRLLNPAQTRVVVLSHQLLLSAVHSTSEILSLPVSIQDVFAPSSMTADRKSRKQLLQCQLKFLVLKACQMLVIQFRLQKTKRMPAHSPQSVRNSRDSKLPRLSRRSLSTTCSMSLIHVKSRNSRLSSRQTFRVQQKHSRLLWKNFLQRKSV